MKLKNNISNKKGFTMVELLATIVILGILSIVSIVAVNKILENSKKEYYKSLEETVRLAGESYVQNNRKYLPKYIGGKTVVPLEELQEQNYIKEVKDYNKNDCYTDKTYVQIFKYSKTKYTYRAYLNCPDYTNEAEIDDTAPSITINLSNDPSKISITFRGGPEGQDIELLSYRYIIYRDKKEISNTGDIEANSKKEVTVSLNLKESTPGKIKIKAVATNIYGQSTTVQNTKTYEDENPPICIIKDEDQITSPKSWTNSDRKITVECDDGDGFGCEQDEYSVNFNTTKQNGIITIRDSAGNETDCPVSVYVDKTAPTCTNTSNYTTWTNMNRTIKYGCDDSDSGCESTIYGTKTIDTTMKQFTIPTYTIKDKAGNTTICSDKKVNVYVDKTAPKCTVNATPNDLNGWFNKNANITLSYSDSDSNIATYDLTTSSTASYNNKTSGTQEEETKSTTWYGYVKDKAGNVGQCTKEIKLDKTPPTVKITAYKQGTSTVIKATKTNPATFDIGTSSDKIRIELDKSDAYSGVGEVTLNNLEGLNSNGHVYLSTEKTHNGTISIFDKAGNERKITVKAELKFTPILGANNCNIRGNTIYNGWSYTCSHGDYTGIRYYQRYCTDSTGNLDKAPSSIGDYICPLYPYGTVDGWTIIDDSNWPEWSLVASPTTGT